MQIVAFGAFASSLPGPETYCLPGLSKPGKLARKAEAGSPSAIALTCDEEVLARDCVYSTKHSNLRMTSMVSIPDQFDLRGIESIETTTADAGKTQAQ